MLEVQKFLIKNHRQSEPGYNFSLLESELGIKCNYHLEYPLVILNYDQLDSPKLHPIVMECRGLVLDTTNYDVVASCMKRFFNLGEATEITDKFDWTFDKLQKYNNGETAEGIVIRPKEPFYSNVLKDTWSLKCINREYKL